MAKHDDSQPDSSTQTTALSRRDEGALARAIGDLAAVLRERPDVGASVRPHNSDAAFAANEYRAIKGALRTFFERGPEHHHYSKSTDGN